MAPTLSAEAWAQIRYDYEHTQRPIEDICAEHGISSGTLRDRMRRWGWTRRRPPIPREGPPPLPAPLVVRRPAVGAFDAVAPSALNEVSPHSVATRSYVDAGYGNVPTELGVDPLHEGEGIAFGEERCHSVPSPARRERVASEKREPGEGRNCGQEVPLAPSLCSGTLSPLHGAGGAMPLERAVCDSPPHKREGQDEEAGISTSATGIGALDVATAPIVSAGDDATVPTVNDGNALVPLLQSAVARVLPAIETIVARLGAGATQPREMEQAGRALGALTRTLRELNALLDERRPPAAADRSAGPDDKSAAAAAAEPDGPVDLDEFRLELIRRMNAIIDARPAEP